MNYIQYMQTPSGPLSTKPLSDEELLDQNMQKALQYVPNITPDYSYGLQDLNSDHVSDDAQHSRIIGGRYNDFYNTITIDPNYNTVPVAVHELEHAAQDQYNEKKLEKIWDKVQYYINKVGAANSERAKKYYENKRNLFLDRYGSDDYWYKKPITKRLNKLFDFDIREVGATLREASSEDWQEKSFSDLINTNGYYDDIMNKYYLTLSDKLQKARNPYADRLDYYSNQYYKDGISDQRRDRIYNRYKHVEDLWDKRDQRVRQRHDNKYLRFFKRFNNL